MTSDKEALKDDFRLRVVMFILSNGFPVKFRVTQLKLVISFGRQYCDGVGLSPRENIMFYQQSARVTD